MFDLPEAGSAGADPAVNAETLEGPAEPVGFAAACPRQDAELTGEDEVAADDDRLAQVLDGQAPLNGRAVGRLCLLVGREPRA